MGYQTVVFDFQFCQNFENQVKIMKFLFPQNVQDNFQKYEYKHVKANLSTDNVQNIIYICLKTAEFCHLECQKVTFNAIIRNFDIFLL